METDISKIAEAGTSYAQKARELGISMFLGPMIELYVAGRVPETDKGYYFGDTTESIQKIGLSFAQGIGRKGSPCFQSLRANRWQEKGNR